MRLDPMGDGAWRVELPPSVDRRLALETLAALPRVLDVVVADRHALVRFDPANVPADPRDALAHLPAETSAEVRRHVVRVRYDGPDLDDVARATNLTTAEVTTLHAREYRVELVGFMPGFAYMGPLDPRLVVPRRATPRVRVPALSVGIAAGRTGIYPFASPGGWHLVGTAVDFVPFDPTTGARLQLGDRVVLEPA
jgi:UPF0271 protein